MELYANLIHNMHSSINNLLYSIRLVQKMTKMTNIPTGKTKTNGRIAVRDTAVSGYHGHPIDGPPVTYFEHHSTIVLKGLRRALIEHPLCRETQVI